MTKNDIDPLIAVIRDNMGTDVPPQAKLAVEASLTLLGGALVDLGRIADALEALQVSVEHQNHRMHRG